MAFGARHSFMRGAFPNNFPRCFVQGVYAPGMLGHVGRRIHVAKQPMAENGVGIAADGGGDKNAIAPDDGARMSQPGDLGLPADIHRLDAVEAGWTRTFRYTRCAGPAKRGPVLGAGAKGYAK